MFERLLKAFLTVDTGEAYQPIRLTYKIINQDKLIATLNSLKCCEKTANANTWNWYWRDECEGVRFESLDTYKKNLQNPSRLGTLAIRQGTLYINLPSFKRACLGVPFFHRYIPSDVALIERADFINKVFATDERLPHGFSELFKEDELEKILQKRLDDYQKVQEQVEHAASADEALKILSEYTQAEAQKRLPYVERYAFDHTDDKRDPDMIYLGFYIFLRSRELVAIRRWFGETGYTLANAAEETVEQVFGGMDIDIIE